MVMLLNLKGEDDGELKGFNNTDKIFSKAKGSELNPAFRNNPQSEGGICLVQLIHVMYLGMLSHLIYRVPDSHLSWYARK